MIGIIGAMETEIEILRGEMKNVRVEKKSCFEFYVGKLSGKDVVLLQCGIGKVQAAVGCALLIDTYKPEYIINTGTAGGINTQGVFYTDIPSDTQLPDAVRPAGQDSEAGVKNTILVFGDAVVSTGLVYHDVEVTVFGYKPGQVPGGPPQIFPADDGLVAAAEKAVAELRGEKLLPPDFKAITGLIASGDQFMSNSQKIIELAKVFQGLRAVEMEGAAIAHTAWLFKTPFLVLRCISDIAGEESPITHDKYVPIASKHSSEIVKRILTMPIMKV